MNGDNKLRSTHIFLFLLLLYLISSSGKGIDLGQNAIAGLAGMPNWQLEDGWELSLTDDGYELIAYGQGRAAMEKPCKEESLKLLFRLKMLIGSLNANININGRNSYVISFVNNENGTLSTYLARYIREFPREEVSRPYEQLQGQNIPYNPDQEYRILIASGSGQIKVSYLIDSRERLTVIDYIDENPLPSGDIAFSTPNTTTSHQIDVIEVTNQVQIDEIEIICPNQNADLPNLRTGYFKRPSRSMLISTPWGDVPSNQILVVVNNAANFQIAEEMASGLATDLDGMVVGEFEFINLFQIETNSENLTELLDDLAYSSDYPYISLAFPNEQVFLEANPLDDPIYSKGRSDGYQLVEAERAWNHVKGKEMYDVIVGVTDNGLYRGYGEFDGPVEINITAPYSNLTTPASDFPEVGSHGTGVMNLLAADPDNGGIVGIASEPLRENLSVTMFNIFPDGLSYVTDSLLGLKAEIEGGCTILSCSWGDSEAHEDTVAAYRKFFNKIYDRYPCLLFVCSAGNDGSSLDGSKRIPNGKSLPNIITVGNVLNDGKRVEGTRGSNMKSNNFEVTLASPGQNAIWGWDRKNNPNSIKHNEGGTSMATPHVSAAAAIIRSLRPDLPGADIKDILKKSATDQPPELGGVLNIYRAVEGAMNAKCEICENCSALVNREVEVPEPVDIVIPDTNRDLGYVVGKVFNRNTGKGVASAEMIVKRNPDGEPMLTGIMTNGTGYYRLELPQGQYVISAQASGYGIVPWTVDVYRGQTTMKDIKAVRGV